MKYKQIILFFTIALPVSLALRLVQLFYIVEPSTGFFKQGFDAFGDSITAIIIAVALALSVFAFFSHRSPEQPAKSNLGISICSVLFGLAVTLELCFGGEIFGVVMWQKVLLYVFGTAFIIWLFAFAVKDLLKISLPTASYIIPILFFILKIICNFSGISALALISDNVLLILAYCFSLMFMLNFGKLYNRLDTERGFRKLLATGLASVVLCFTQSIPNTVYHFAVKGYLHTELITNISVFFTGVFIAVFLFSHFSYKNACKY